MGYYVDLVCKPRSGKRVNMTKNINKFTSYLPEI
jgi:hypothetical protein